MSEWITHRLPTAAETDDDGNVIVPCGIKEHNGVPYPGEGIFSAGAAGIAIGDPWWPGNVKASIAAMAEQKAAKAAANLDPTPEPAAEPSPAVAGVPSDEELWELQRDAMGWCPGNRSHDAYAASYRALYDKGVIDGYRRCLEEAKATSELNSWLASDLTALQEENARLKSKVEDLNGEIKSLAYGINNFISVNTDKAEAKQRQFDDACKRIAELEHENTKLKDVPKDLLHSGSQPEMVFVGDLEGELERRGGEVKLEPESKPAPAPEPASFKPFSCGGCRWYSDSNSETGLCCRYAPTHKGNH